MFAARFWKRPRTTPRERERPVMLASAVPLGSGSDVGVLRGRRRESCAPGEIVFLTLCDRSAVCVRVDVLGSARSWQTQDIHGVVDVYSRRPFRRRQWEAERSGRGP